MGHTSTCTSRLFQYSNFDALSECDFSSSLSNALSTSSTSPRNHLVVRKNLSFPFDAFTDEDKVDEEVEVEEVEERVTARIEDQESKGEEESSEMCNKIDDLSARIQAMIIQGLSALHAPLPGIDPDPDVGLARRAAHSHPHAHEQAQVPEDEREEDVSQQGIRNLSEEEDLPWEELNLRLRDNNSSHSRRQRSGRKNKKRDRQHRKPTFTGERGEGGSELQTHVVRCRSGSVLVHGMDVLVL